MFSAAKYHAVDLAKYIVSLCNKEKSPITNLQLQKILFYIQKAFLATNELAFGDPIEAWQFGPVVREVYYYFCGYGAMPISSTYDFMPEQCDLDRINDIVREKRELDPWKLVEDTHQKDKSWYTVYNNGLGNKHIIDVELIADLG